MNKIKLIILFAFCISCSKKSEIESMFITDKNQYWGFTNYCLDIKDIFFKYDKNGGSEKYLLHVNEGFYVFDKNEVLQRKPIVWFIKNDTTFVYDNSEYKIDKISDEEILLSYYHYKIKDKKCFVRFIKWVDGPEGPKPLKPVKEK